MKTQTTQTLKPTEEERCDLEPPKDSAEDELHVHFLCVYCNLSSFAWIYRKRRVCKFPHSNPYISK